MNTARLALFCLSFFAVVVFAPLHTAYTTQISNCLSLAGGFEEIARFGRGGLGDFSLNPDGTILAAIYSSGIYFSEIPTLEPIPFSLEENSRSWAVEWSPDGTRLADADRSSGEVHIWDATTGQLLDTLHITLEIDDVSLNLRWSPDGRYLAALSNTTLKVWDVTDRQEVISYNPRLGPYFYYFADLMTWSPDGDYFAASSNETVTVWNTASWEVVQSLQTTLYTVDTLAWSTTDLLAVGGREGFEIWDTNTWQRTTASVRSENIEDYDGITSAAWTTDGDLLALGSSNRAVYLFDPATETVDQTITGFSDYVRELVWALDSTQLIARTRHGALYVWNGNTFVAHIDNYWSTELLAWSSDGTRLAVTYSQGNAAESLETVKFQIRVWDTVSHQLLATLETDTKRYIADLVWSPDGNHLATAYDETVRVWNAADGWNTSFQETHDELIFDLLWSPDSSELAAVGRDVHLWDVENHELLFELENLDGIVIAGETSSWHIAVISQDNTLQVDNLMNLDAAPLSPEESRIWDYIESETIRRLVATLPNGISEALQVWDLDTEQVLLELNADHFQPVRLSPLGNRLIVESFPALEIHNANTGASLFTINGSVNLPTVASYSPDEKCVAVVAVQENDDIGEIAILDGETGAPIITLEGHTGPIHHLAWSPDGSLLASTSSDGTARLWGVAH